MLIRRALAGCWLILGVLHAAQADEPASSYIFPAGGQVGTVCQVRIGGLCLHDGCGLEMLGPGVEVAPALKKTKTIWFEGPQLESADSQRIENYPQDYASQVSIAANAPLGVRYWHTWTSQGASPALKFVVGELPEIVEEEIEGEPIPVSVTLPVTINGRIFPREDVDVWSFRAQRGQSLRAEVCALRLGSPLEARLEIIDDAGRSLAENSGLAGSDPAVDFTAPVDGIYEVRIHDINFGGLQHYVYRLTLSHNPHVTSIYPLGGRRGSSVPFELLGQGVPAAPVEVALPIATGSPYLHRFEFPAVTSNDKATSGNQKTNQLPIELGDLAEFLEQEPNDDAPQSPAITPPVVLNGRIQRPGDVDCYHFHAQKGVAFNFDLRASRLGSPLDSMLILLDAAGKELARADDVVAGQTDSRLRFTAPAEGTYYLRVEDRLTSRGGPAFAYRLHVTPAEPEFRLVLASDVVTVPRDGQGKLRVNVDAVGPLEAPIQLSIDGLPEGVTLDKSEIPAKAAQFELKFNAADSAEIGAARIVIRGTLRPKTGDAVTRTAAAITAYGDPPLEQVLLAVAMPTPFKLVGAYASPSMPRGTVYAKHFTIERNGFDGPIEIRLADRQARHLQGLTGPIITVPAESSEFDYPVSLPPWMEMGRTSRAVIMASGNVLDSHGRPHVVFYSSHGQNDQIISRISGSMLELSTDQPSLRVRPGEVAEVAVHLSRDGSISSSALRLELITLPPTSGIAAEPVVVPGDRSTATMRVRFAPNCIPGTMPIVIRGTATMHDQPLVAESQLELVK